MVRPLSAGEQGSVYEAIDRLRGQRVALKTLPPLAGDAVESIRSEFRALSAIRHPNVVRLFELVVDQWPCFFTMELVLGVDFVAWAQGRSNSEDSTVPGRLLDEIDQTAPFAPLKVDYDQLREALGQLAEGLHAIHEAGRVHRDLRAPNVMVTPSGRVVVLGLALNDDASKLHAAPRERSDADGAADLAYLAPEVATGAPTSAASDWYAFGALLFEALTGQRPFAGPAPRVLADKLNRQAPLARRLAPEAPPGLSDLCRRLLARDPADRPLGPEVRRRLHGRIGRPLASVDRTESLVGRQEDEALLAEGLRAAERRRLALLRLHGPSGVGKTALAQSFCKQVERSSATAVYCPGHPQPRVPLKTLSALVEGVLSVVDTTASDGPSAQGGLRLLAQMCPALQRSSLIRRDAQPPHLTPRERAVLAARGLCALLEVAATPGPLVIVLDDLHLGDADTGRMLRLALGDACRLPLLLIGIHQEPDDRLPAWPSSPVDGWDASVWVRQAAVAPLKPSAGRRLAQERLQVDAQIDALMTQRISTERAPEVGLDRAELVAKTADGLPFAIVRLASEVASLEPDVLITRTLPAVLAEQLARLQPVARALLECVATSHEPVLPAMALRVAGLDQDDRSTIRALVDQGWLGGDQAMLDVAHPRLREATLLGMSSEVRRRRHLALAEVLMNSPAADPFRVAFHLEQANEGRRAAPYLLEAARQALTRLAFEHAAVLYRDCLRVGASASPPWELWAWHAEALAYAGRLRDSATAYYEGAQTGDPETAFEMRRLGAHNDVAAGHDGRGLRVLSELLSVVGLSMPASIGAAAATIGLRWAAVSMRGLSWTLRSPSAVDPSALMRIDACWSMATAQLWTDPRHAEFFSTQLWKLASMAGEPFRLGRSFVLGIVVAVRLGRSDDRCVKLMEALVRLAAETSDSRLSALVDLASAWTAYRGGQWAQVEASAAVFITRSAHISEAFEVELARRIALEAAVHQGRWRQAEHQLVDLGRIADASGARRQIRLYKTSWPASMVRLATDETERVRKHVGRDLVPPSPEPFTFDDFSAAASLVSADLYEGLGVAAYARLDAIWPLVEAAPWFRSKPIEAEGLFLRVRTIVAAANDDPEYRTRVPGIPRQLRRLEKLRYAPGAAYAALLGAQMTLLAGEHESARAYFGDAVTAFRNVSMDAIAAVGLLRQGALTPGDEGRWLRNQGERELSERGIGRPDAFARVYAPVVPGEVSAGPSRAG